jgi:MFS family permease
VVGGFVLSLIVVLLSKLVLGEGVWAVWGWRVPFVLSLVLLAVSLWMRLKLSESPVFQAMRAENRQAKNPFVESFTYPGNPKRLFVALLGVAAGLTVIWYTAMFRGLSFLTGPMHVEETAAEIIVGICALVGMSFFVLFGSLSDRIGRKAPIVWGYALTLVLLFPCFWAIGWAMGPSLAIAGPDVKITPGGTQILVVMGALLTLSALSGATYGPVAALLAEMFPPKIRYSSVSIPYHFGTGYFGGFLPLIATWIVARTGNPYSELWYTWGVVLVALIVAMWGLKGGPPQDFEETE